MRSSIKEIIEKIKHFLTNVPQDALWAVIVILIGFAAFGLGRLSILDENKEPIKLLYNNTLSKQPNVVLQDVVVVSKSGSKYHYPWCGGALRIKEYNKRWYASIREARAAGYSPAGNCKGLK